MSTCAMKEKTSVIIVMIEAETEIFLLYELVNLNLSADEEHG